MIERFNGDRRSSETSGVPFRYEFTGIRCLLTPEVLATSATSSGARATPDPMRPPVPKRVTAAPSRLRRGAGSLTSVGVVGSRTTAMGLFAGCLALAPGELRPRDSASDIAGYRSVTQRIVEFSAFDADTRGRPSPIQDATADPRCTGMSLTGERPDGEPAPCEITTRVES
jgi:hypothetical protein